MWGGIWLSPAVDLRSPHHHRQTAAVFEWARCQAGEFEPRVLNPGEDIKTSESLGRVEWLVGDLTKFRREQPAVDL